MGSLLVDLQEGPSANKATNFIRANSCMGTCLVRPNQKFATKAFKSIPLDQQQVIELAFISKQYLATTLAIENSLQDNLMAFMGTLLVQNQFVVWVFGKQSSSQVIAQGLE